MLSHWSITTAIALSLVTAPLAAQGVSHDTTPEHAALVAAESPVVVPSVVGERTSLLVSTRANTVIEAKMRSTDIAPVRSALPSEVGHNPAMMIVGGAALLVGAVVGGKGGAVIMVGGGVLGLIGLWNYLR